MRKMRRNLTFLYDLHVLSIPNSLCALSKINMVLRLIFCFGISAFSQQYKKKCEQKIWDQCLISWTRGKVCRQLMMKGEQLLN